MNICEMSLLSLKKALDSGTLTSEAVVKAYRDAWEADQKSALPLNGYIEFFEDAIDLAREAGAALRGQRQYFDKGKVLHLRQPDSPGLYGSL